jgi:integrase
VVIPVATRKPWRASQETIEVARKAARHTAAFLVLQGTLDLAVADEAIRKSPAKSSAVRVPGHQAFDIEVWDDPVVVAVIDAHPDELRAIPEPAAYLGMREGELFGLAEEDFDLDQEKIVRVRRQVKRIGRVFVFALPKNDRERVIALSDWDVQVTRRHISRYPPRPYAVVGETRRQTAHLPSAVPLAWR